MFNEDKNLKALPGMEEALMQVHQIDEKLKKDAKKPGKPKRWWDDDDDGIGYEKGEVSGKFRKEELEEIFDMIAEELDEELDVLTDEQLEDIIFEALDSLEDGDELVEALDYFENVELLDESAVLARRQETQRRRDQAKDRLATSNAMKSAAAKSAEPKAAEPSKVERVKAAVKNVAKKVTSAAGKVAGKYQGEKEAARIKAKRASMQATPPKKKETEDDDGTGGKLDALLAKTRGTDEKKSTSGSTAAKPSTSGSTKVSSGGGGVTVNVNTRGGSSGSSGGSSGGSSSGSTRKALKSAGAAIVRAGKKVVGKTARLVAKGANKVATKLGEDVTCPVCGSDPCQCLEGTIDEAARNRYAIGMAKAQELTGDTPPLKKSTINKAHKIAKAIEEGKNKEGKEQGADGKACWKGYRYAGTDKNGKDKCVPVEELQSMHDSLMESGLFDEDEIRNIIGEAWEELDEATAMKKRGHDEASIRNNIAANTGGGAAADRATKLADRPTYGNNNKAQQRQNLARAQRRDFRNTTSSNPGLHGYGHKSDDPKVRALQSARGKQRGVLTPDEKSKLGEELHPSVKRIDAMNKERVAQRAAAAASDAAAKQRSAAAFQAHKKAHIAAGGTPVSALDTWQQKKNSEGKK